MPMFFNSSTFVRNFLVNEWNATCVSELLLMIAFTFAFAWLIEIIKQFDEQLSRASQSSEHVVGQSEPAIASISAASPLLASSTNSVAFSGATPINEQQAALTCKQHRLAVLCVRTTLRTVSYGIGNILMLAVMCYNIWVLIGCCVGHSVGHLFAVTVLRKRAAMCSRAFLQRMSVR